MSDQHPEILGGCAKDADWRIAFHLNFSFELPTEQLEALIPEEVTAVETVPGRGLLNLIHARYVPGNLDGLDAFDELVCSVVVESDLSIEMPVPRLTLHILDVMSNSGAFVDYKIPALKMPVRHEASLTAEIRDDRMGSTVADADGPIFSLACGVDAPTFKNKSFCGQYFSAAFGLHHGVWSWHGSMFETQRHRREAGVIHAHPFFERIGLTDLGTPPCFMQQVSRPHEVVHMRTYRPRQMRAPHETPATAQAT